MGSLPLRGRDRRALALRALALRALTVPGPDVELRQHDADQRQRGQAGVSTAGRAGRASAAGRAAPGPVYTPDDEQSTKAIARLAAGDQLTTRFPCWSEHYPERTAV